MSDWGDNNTPLDRLASFNEQSYLQIREKVECGRLDIRTDGRVVVIHQHPSYQTSRASMERPAIAEFVRKDSLAGVRLDVTGIPTFLVNDTRIAGFGHDGALAALVEKKLKALR